MSEPTISHSPAAITALWRSLQPTSDEVRHARRRLHLKAIAILSLVATSYWVLVISDSVLPVRVVAAVALAVSLVAVGTGIMHDANHGSFSRRRWVNRTLAYSSDALGASSLLWRVQHNTLHHGNTNVVGHDADLELGPFARLAPTQRWHWWYRAQHIYIWPLYGFLALKNLLIADLVTVVSGRLDGKRLREPMNARTVVTITAGKLAHLGWAVVVPLIFNPWQVVLIFYLGCSWLVGFVLAVTFQLAHCVDIAELPAPEQLRRGDHFAVHQLQTTADIAATTPVVGHFFRWLVGGLDHQIEHHLAPGLPHTAYPTISRRFREQCRLQGVAYKLHPGVLAAVRSHARWLHTMSRPQPASVRLRAAGSDTR